jgi:hypothetical protein
MKDLPLALVAYATLLAISQAAVAATPGASPAVIHVSAPEGGAPLLYLLLAGFACVGAMLFSSRNHIGKRRPE